MSVSKSDFGAGRGALEDITRVTVQYRAPHIFEGLTKPNALADMLGPPEPRTLWSRLADRWSRMKDAWLVLRGKADICQ